MKLTATAALLAASMTAQARLAEIERQAFHAGFRRGTEEGKHGAAPVPAAQAGVLSKPAKVGAVRFGVGVSERLVIEAAQRQYEYAQETNAAVKDSLTTECDCPADKMPFGRCCKASQPVADDVVRDADRYRFIRSMNEAWMIDRVVDALNVPEDEFDAHIDSAILAAQRQKDGGA